MRERHISKKLLQFSSQFPVITLTGPRQSGKTTLCKHYFPNYDYVTLESLDNRQEATEDPRGFLDKYKEGVILDEIQNTPELTSYIQEYVDNDTSLKYVLTGSEQLRLTQSVSQSLAGRTAILRLLPFSYSEAYDTAEDIDHVLYTGFYPRIFSSKLNPTDALLAYTNTYVQRDVRSLSNIRNMRSFEKFLRLAAANTGQLLSYTRLANDLDVDQETVKAWISVLEASFICFRLYPYSKNLRKRLTKTPKLFFYDVGLASYLLGIRSREQVASHPSRGALFENFAIVELLKSFWNKGLDETLYFLRDSAGNEVDVIFDFGGKTHGVEIKSTKTLLKDKFKSLEFFQKIIPENALSYLIYGGKTKETKYGCRITPYNQIEKLVSFPPVLRDLEIL